MQKEPEDKYCSKLFNNIILFSPSSGDNYIL